jgi:hypothetical protein
LPDLVAALAGVGVAVIGLAALLISEHTPLFGFMEHGSRFAVCSRSHPTLQLSHCSRCS